MIPPWITGAAMLAAQENNAPDPEGGTLYPEYGEGNATQARASAYYGQNYGEEPRAIPVPFDSAEYIAQQSHAKLISELVYYMMVKMEPTDRCLRMPGDYYTVEDAERDAEEARIRREKRESGELTGGE